MPCIHFGLQAIRHCYRVEGISSDISTLSPKIWVLSSKGRMPWIPATQKIPLSESKVLFNAHLILYLMPHLRARLSRMGLIPDPHEIPIEWYVFWHVSPLFYDSGLVSYSPTDSRRSCSVLLHFFFVWVVFFEITLSCFHFGTLKGADRLHFLVRMRDKTSSMNVLRLRSIFFLAIFDINSTDFFLFLKALSSWLPI